MATVRTRTRCWCAVLAALASLAPPAGASLAEDRAARRDDARRRRAEAARQVDALTATDEALEAAVADLGAQVAAQEASVDDARQAVEAALAAARAAEARLAVAEAEVAELRRALKERAVAAYVRPPPVGLSFSGARDLGEASRRWSLLDTVAARGDDAADRLGAARDDLDAAARAAGEARDLATQRRQEEQARLSELLSARADKARLSGALDERIREFQADADAAAAQEAELTRLIAAKEADAAARAAAAARPRPAPRAPAAGGTSPVAASASGFAWPLAGPVTSGFGMRWGRLHAGLDVAAGSGTPIRAAAAGTVVFAGVMGGYGNVVVLGHGGGLTTLYAHQSRLAASVGAAVARGQVIGFVGSTGHSTGPHLHFETRVDGRPRNPRAYLP